MPRDRPRSPTILWRLLATDLARTCLLAAAALVGVISFAGAIRPLAEGQVGLAGALQLTGLLLVPMLQYALPFAAGFAATLAYHRFAADNEALAAHAAGLAHRTLVLPAAAIGLLLAALLVLLSSEAIPVFLRSAERIVQRDIARFFSAPIERGQPIELGDYLIHAESVVGPIPAPAGSGATEVLRLSNVLAIRPGDQPDDQVGWYVAERIDAWFREDPDRPDSTFVQLTSTNAVFNTEGADVRQGTQTSRVIPIPSAAADDPKFLRRAELRRAAREPRRLAAVDQRARALAARLVEQQMIAALDQRLRADGAATLARGGDRLTLRAGALDLISEPGDAPVWQLRPGPAGEVRLRLDPEAGPALEHAAVDAAVSLREADVDPARRTLQPALRIELRDVRTTTPSRSDADAPPGDEPAPIVRALQRYSDLVPLTPAGEPAADASIFDQPAAALLADAKHHADADAALGPDIARLARRLDDRIERLRREILSKRHERLAYSAACLVLVFTGAVVALRLRDHLPLPVFLWTFFPGLATVITISAGQRVTYEQGPVGLLLLWGGVLGLAAYALGEFRKLARR